MGLLSFLCRAKAAFFSAGVRVDFLSEEESLFLNYIKTITSKIKINRDTFTLFIYENKSKVLFVYTHNDKRGDIYIFSGNMYHKCHFLEVSVSVKKLSKAQQQFFPNILKTFKSKPELWEKKEDWGWYVWPTEKEGDNDPRKTAVKNFADVNYILSDSVILSFWKKILFNLSVVLNVQGRNGIPSKDHDRINHFIKVRYTTIMVLHCSITVTSTMQIISS